MNARTAVANAAGQTLTPYNDLPCCPELDTTPVCDIVDFRRRLVFPTPVRGPREEAVKVEVTLHTRFTRCPGPLALGDIAYSTTLLPGEKVRLATTDRRSRFSFDSETKLAYRSEQMSEEQYRMRALRTFMADENMVDRGSEHYSEQGKWDFHGDASGGLGFFSAHADTNANGSHSGSSAHDYLREHSRHAQMADAQSVDATRMAHSVSIGEVSTRSHSEGESEDHFEAASREFANPNKCHAVTFMFYRLNKLETLRFEIVAIERRVLDPAAPVPVPANPFRSTGNIATIPQEVPATHDKRVATLNQGIEADQQVQLQALAPLPGSSARTLLASRLAVGVQPVLALGEQQPLADAVREQALKFVDHELQQQGLLGPDGSVSKEVQQRFGFERRTALPTAGVIVKSCMDACGICEPEVERQHQLELDRLELQNKLLARQIELLDKAQEYRCCPAGEEAPAPTP